MDGQVIRVIDNFCPFAEVVRQSALAAGFGTWRPNKGEVGSSVYEGMGFWGDHARMIEALMFHTGTPVIPNSMFFRMTNLSTEGAYIHSDREMGDYTCVAYLTQGEESIGTGFYRNRRTGAERMLSFAEMSAEPEEFQRLKQEMTRASEDDWQQTSFIAGAFNRAVIFDAPLFHARYPRHGLAETPEEGRLVWVSHFMIPGGRHG